MIMKSTTSIAATMLFILLLAIGVASAAETRINITMTETVNQNITFAEDFILDESIKYCQIDGIVNVTNPNAETVADINLTFSNTDNMITNFTLVGGRNGTQTQGISAGDNFTIHIVELRGNEYSAFGYTIDCITVEPPLNIDTNYSNAETGINRKVLAGHNWTVTQYARNQLAIGQPINNINITIAAQGIVWNATTENFTLAYLEPLGDYVNVYGNGTDNYSWYWEVNGSTLNPSGESNISYVVRAPNNVPTSGTYLALQETLSYTVGYLASNLSLDTVIGVGDIDFWLDKQIVSPADNENNTNVTWEVNADITVPFNISYNLTQVSVWVTSTVDPTDYVTPFGRLNTTYLPGQEINDSISWAATPWYFNYTDASNNISSRPPIVWMRPYFTILNAYGQIVNTTLTQNGNDIYMKYIYVINGYWLQINKNITNIGADQYRVDTLVENIGNAWTPEGLVVTVYDFVPAEFAPWNWSVAYDSTASVTGSGFNGTSYRWSIAGKDPYNSSLGPASETLANRTWTLTYNVNGSGDYKVSELYIVGLDPRKVDGAGTHEGITVVNGFKSASSEVFYAAVVFFLVIINVINFVMTRKINQKLNN